MDLRPSVVLITLLLFLLVGCNKLPQGRSDQLKTGPNLLSEADTIKLAKEQAKLLTVDKVEMDTAGPIYRVVFGLDANNVRKVIWVSDHIEYQENLDKGISREDAMKIARERGFDNNTGIQLVYIPQKAKQIASLRNSPSNIFWWVRTPDAEITHQLFLNFYYGTVVYEWEKK
ncbi:MAG: hypothetical protein ABSC17_06195 [Thermacetogeniaceae bacterium]